MSMKLLIYSRKSKFTGKGDSIENQIDMCREHARRLFGDDIDCSVYEDEGYSGKNTARPEFRRMMDDVRRGGYQILICYRLDRISRSVSDFSAILEELQARGVGFISIRENFDTTTPMGRAMIHIAAVFAELERETIAERVRDNKYRQYRNGHWQGGVPPLGYASRRVDYLDRNGARRSYQTLETVPADAETARMIFEKYLALGSFSKLETDLNSRQIPSPKGGGFTRAGLRTMLRNPVYAVNDPCVYDYLLGKGADLANGRDEYDGTRSVIAYGKIATKNARLGTRQHTGIENWVVAVSDHEGIVSGEVWTRTQTLIDRNRAAQPRANTSRLALLSTLLRCARCGSTMEPSGQRVYASGEPGFYYICSLKKASRGEKCQCPNLRGVPFDREVLAQLRLLLQRAGFPGDDILYERDAAGEHAKALRRLEKRRRANAAAVRRLALKLAASVSPQSDALLLEAMRSLQDEEERLGAEIDREQEASRRVRPGGETVREAYAAFLDGMESWDHEMKRAVLHQLVESITWDGKTATVHLRGDG